MKILAVTNAYPTERSPTQGTFIEQQIKGLRGAGLDVDVTVIDRAQLGYRAYLNLGERMRNETCLSRPALVHVMYGGVLAKTVVKAVVGLPVIVSFCGSDLQGENLPGLLRKTAVMYGVRCSRFAARHAQGVIVKSKNLWAALPVDMEKTWVRIIPNGIDLDRFQPMDSSECRRKLGWGQDRFHVLCPADAGKPGKRFWLAVAAVREAQRAGARAELHRLEGVRHEDVPLWLNASDCLILTSEREGSPNIVKEALACCVPVVSVDVGDVSERIREIAGCHVCAPDPRELAARLVGVSNGPRRIQSRTQMDGLSLNKVAERLIDFYQCITAEWAKTHEHGSRKVVRRSNAHARRNSDQSRHFLLDLPRPNNAADPLRVLSITNIFPSPDRPWLGTFVEQQIAGLRSVGVETRVLYFNRKEKGPFIYYRMGSAVAEAIATFRPHLIHVMYGGVMAARITRQSWSVPVVVTFHGSDLLGENLSGTVRKLISHYGVRCSWRAARRASGIVVVARHLERTLPGDVDRRKMRVIPCGIDLTLFQPMDREACRRQLGWADGTYHVLFPAGAGDPVKRPWLARAALEELRQEHGINGELHMLSGVPYANVPLWINASDALVLTSSHEGSPMVVKEALACNVPVVSVDVGDVAERLAGIEGCQLVGAESRDIALGLLHVWRRRRQVDSARLLQPLSILTIAEQLKAFYGELLQPLVTLRS